MIKQGMNSENRPQHYYSDKYRYQKILDESYIKECQNVMARQIGKVTEMKEQSRTRNKTHHGSIRAVLIIRNWPFSASEELVLNKELKFVTTIRRDPSLVMIAPVEYVARL